MSVLQDFKQNEFHQSGKMSKSSSSNNNNKKFGQTGKGNAYEIQINIGIAYNEILQIVKENGFGKDLRLPEDGVKSVEKLDLIKKTVMHLVECVKKGSPGNTNGVNKQNSANDLDESNMINCADCQNYEVNLQKLQNQVRQHIRLQQQLKIYQQSMEQKIEELKKEKSQADKKVEDVRRKLDEQKNQSTGNSQKLHKLQFENEKLKTQIKQLKTLSLQSSKKIKGYESRQNRQNHRQKQNHMSKQNRIDWAHRMSSLHKKDDPTKEKQKIPSTYNTDRNMIGHEKVDRQQKIDRQDKTDRKSIQKRCDSSDRWRMSNARSTKIISFNDKIIQQKNKEERKKAIQSKFQYRR